MYFFKHKSSNVAEKIFPIWFVDTVDKTSLYTYTACAGVAFFLGISLKYSNSCDGFIFVFLDASFLIFIELLKSQTSIIATTIANITVPAFLAFSALALLAFASLAHTVSFSITSFSLSLEYVLPEFVIIAVGKRVLISIYLPALKLFTSNSILFAAVA